MSKQTIMQLRPAVLSDSQRICTAHKASIETLCAKHYSREDIEGWLGILSPEIYEAAIKEKVMIVGEKGGEISGFGILDTVGREICAVYIHPNAAGAGLGREILLELEHRALEKGIDTLGLCATINALGFYEHHGYEKEGQTFHNLPGGTRLPCTKMRKTLAGTQVPAG